MQGNGSRSLSQTVLNLNARQEAITSCEDLPSSVHVAPANTGVRSNFDQQRQSAKGSAALVVDLSCVVRLGGPKCNTVYQMWKTATVEFEDFSRAGRFQGPKYETVIKHGKRQTWNSRISRVLGDLGGQNSIRSMNKRSRQK